MSISWSDYKAHARSKGVMGRELFMVHSVPAAAAEEIEQALPEHLAYQKKLEADGILFAAGPLADEAGALWSMEGLIILRAGSLEEARQIAAADPMHASGKKTFAVRPWLVNEGRLQVDISLSSKSATLPLGGWNSPASTSMDPICHGTAPRPPAKRQSAIFGVLRRAGHRIEPRVRS